MPFPECKDGPGHSCDRCVILGDTCHDEKIPLLIYLKFGVEDEVLQGSTIPGLSVFT